MSHAELIAQAKSKLSSKSRDELIAIQVEYDGTSDPKAQNERIAATQILQDRESKRHNTMVVVGVLGVIAGSVAAYFSYLGYAQPQQASVPTALPAPTIPSGASTSPVPSKPSPSSSQKILKPAEK